MLFKADNLNLSEKAFLGVISYITGCVFIYKLRDTLSNNYSNNPRLREFHITYSSICAQRFPKYL